MRFITIYLIIYFVPVRLFPKLKNLTSKSSGPYNITALFSILFLIFRFRCCVLDVSFGTGNSMVSSLIFLSFVSFSTPSSLSAPYIFHPYLTHHPFLRKGKASHGELAKSNTQLRDRTKALPPISRLNNGSLQREWAPKSQFKQKEYILVPHPVVSQSAPTITTITHIQRGQFGPMLVTCCQSRVSEFPLAQVSCFSRYPHHGLDSFAHIIAPSSLPLDYGSSVKCFTVDICICFHPFLDDGSKMTIKVVVNLITGEGQFRHFLHYCLGSQLGSSF